MAVVIYLENTTKSIYKGSIYKYKYEDEFYVLATGTTSIGSFPGVRLDTGEYYLQWDCDQFERINGTVSLSNQ